ncbi:MAG: patatin-like phospholipase family protein [Deltaproteobacteria bacterium]|nr:patatin-like phospholipase family protein [Deltaproteobacteria bacterium]
MSNKIKNIPTITYFVSGEHYNETAGRLLPFAAKDCVNPDFHKGCIITLPNNKTLFCRLFNDTKESIAIAQSHPMGTIIFDSTKEKLFNGLGNSLTGKILPELLTTTDKFKSPQKSSILVALPNNSITPYYAYAIGTLQLGGVLIEPGTILDILKAAFKISRPANPGKIAIALAGGGIEGMFWEIGVLRALDARLKHSSVTDFDIFSGISAGSVLGAFMANGVHPFEIADALYGRPSRIAPITRSMLFEPNIGELTKRILLSLTDFAKGKWLTSPIDSASKVTPNALFSGNKLKSYLQKEFNAKGMSDDFTTVKKQLFIGATDQDRGRHVTFGTEDYLDIPISTAVRASTAMTPYYKPEQIGDRFYVDGIFTRTIDIDIAIENGATLIICIDPLRPVDAMESGYVHSKGGIFNTVQSVKSMIRTRLDEAISKTEESNPHVSIHVFSPSPKDMEQMSGTMMRFFYSASTEKMAYNSASDQIDQNFEWLEEDFLNHGITLSKVLDNET